MSENAPEATTGENNFFEKKKKKMQHHIIQHRYNYTFHTALF